MAVAPAAPAPTPAPAPVRRSDQVFTLGGSAPAPAPSTNSAFSGVRIGAAQPQPAPQPVVSQPVPQPAPAPRVPARRADGGIAVVGTEYTGTPEVNFANFLREATGANVSVSAVRGGGAFAGFLAYLTSGRFESERPQVIVWENPVYNNVARYGDQPMREIIAAAGGTCRTSLPLQRTDARTLSASLSALDAGRDYTLFLDTGGTPASLASFSFVLPSGLTSTRTVVRRDDATMTGRFYVPLSGIGRDGARSVNITLDAPLGGSASLTACFY
jgi:hypothetical protein